MPKVSQPTNKIPPWARKKQNRWVWDLTLRWAHTYGLYLVKEWASLKMAEGCYCDDVRDMTDNLNHLFFNGVKGLRHASIITVADELLDWTDRFAGDDVGDRVKEAEDQMMTWAVSEAKGRYQPKRVR